jgi:CRISPR/Cas system type I-B associated protein Csh2 (Cas7 group RAMP superfamily)
LFYGVYVILGDTNTIFHGYAGLVHWDDENEIREQVWMGLEIESVEKALWMMIGVGP